MKEEARDDADSMGATGGGEVVDGESGVFENRLQGPALDRTACLSRNDGVPAVRIASPDLVAPLGAAIEHESDLAQNLEHLYVRDGGKSLAHLQRLPERDRDGRRDPVSG